MTEDVTAAHCITTLIHNENDANVFRILDSGGIGAYVANHKNPDDPEDRYNESEEEHTIEGDKEEEEEEEEEEEKEERKEKEKDKGRQHKHSKESSRNDQKGDNMIWKEHSHLHAHKVQLYRPRQHIFTQTHQNH
ncbi:hypothetical protein RFI_18380 [Reticulomyxa filosa]|uniref:Uncharacterized protein n=1 Tax=Reticulomyxa filosa TaxID=46433 RepID=X6MYK3_RETFI|nr:hypothetical protein RFI_18380 [Reticulomyxa filosa]|eukprot:ETO18866.1 hypothetical protein RFI_18380 [Reticulomyxa filosa]